MKINRITDPSFPLKREAHYYFFRSKNLKLDMLMSFSHVEYTLWEISKLNFQIDLNQIVKDHPLEILNSN